MVYGLLTVIYKVYLSKSDGRQFYPDYITNLTARQSAVLLNSIGYESVVLPHNKEASMKLVVRHKFVARVVEGCNAVSVIILF